MRILLLLLLGIQLAQAQTRKQLDLAFHEAKMPAKMLIINHEEYVQKDFVHLFELFEKGQEANKHGHDDGHALPATWKQYLRAPHPSVKTIEHYIAQAALEFDVPVALLRAVASKESNYTHLGPSIDGGWGLMHLTQHAHSNTLEEAAALLQLAPDALKEIPRQNIRGAAALLAKHRPQQPESLASWKGALAHLSGLHPDVAPAQAEEYLMLLKKGHKASTLWGESVDIPSHPSLAHFASGQRVASDDYAPAVSSLTSCNFTAGRLHAIDAWVVHWIGYGTANGAISHFKNCNAQASAHFVIANSGTIYQVVRVENTAWHAGATGQYNNSRSIGIEHEAVVTHPETWLSMPMHEASAKMAKFFAQSKSIPISRSLPGFRGHQEMPGTSTQCPGPVDWEVYMSLVNFEHSPAADNPALDNPVSITWTPIKGQDEATVQFGLTEEGFDGAMGLANPVSTQTAGASNSIQFAGKPNTQYWYSLSVRVGSYGSTRFTEPRSFTVNPPNSELLLYPNPAQQSTTLQLSSAYSGRAYISLYDLLGKKRAYYAVGRKGGSQSFDLPLIGLPAGMYVIEIVEGDRRFAEKLEVE